MLDNTPNQRTKFRTKNCIKIHEDVHGMYNVNSQIKFKTSMLKSSLCDSDPYILVSETKKLIKQEQMMQQMIR